MSANTPLGSRSRLHDLRIWVTDGRALTDLWLATCGLGGPGVMLCLVGAEVIRLGLLGRIDAGTFSTLGSDSTAKAIGLASIHPSVAFGLCVLCAGIVLLMGAWRLIAARAEVLRFKARD